MMARRPVYFLCAAACAATTTTKDDISLMQQSLSSATEAGASFERVTGDPSTRRLLAMAPALSQRMATAAGDNPAASQDAMNNLRSVVQGSAGEGHHEALSQAWSAFTQKTRHLHNPKPDALLESAKQAMVETGAMNEMRNMATEMASKSSGLAGSAASNMDSMIVGFRTSVAPWNNLIHSLALPLVKASFTLFTNFHGATGNTARLCVGAQVAMDSTYGTHAHSEFGGLYLWAGSAKWDNVPGWSFGSGSGGGNGISFLAGGGDFSWVWTLSKEPDTVCFFYEICMFDGDNFHSSMLQTESQAQTEQAWHHYNQKPVATKKRSSTWVQHTWCGADWEFSPSGASGKAQASTPEAAADSTSEDWDPESEAV